MRKKSEGLFTEVLIETRLALIEDLQALVEWTEALVEINERLCGGIDVQINAKPSPQGDGAFCILTLFAE